MPMEQQLVLLTLIFLSLLLPGRPRSKAYHLMLHTAALLLTILGVVAAFKSHTLKRPAATPNL